MKFLIAIAVALGISAVAYGAAAQLNVNGGVLQYGADTDLTCVASVQASGTTLSATNDVVDYISVNGLSTCGGQKVRIGITGTGSVPGGACEWFNGNVDPSDPAWYARNTSLSCGSGNIHNADITDIHITLYSY
jgi:hypothetical protein